MPEPRPVNMRGAALILAILVSAVPSLAAPRVPAEWEPALGTLVRYPFNLPDELVRELAADDLLFTLVDDPTARIEATSHLEVLGVDLARVVFIETPVSSPWTRDWGPIAAFGESGLVHLVDARFEAYPWVPGCAAGSSAGAAPARRATLEDDDHVPVAVGAQLGLSVESLDVLLTGGNFMTDGLGSAWSTDQMLAENLPIMDEATFRARVSLGLGIDRYEFVPSPEEFGIQHIDCFAKLLGPRTVLVKQVQPGHPEYACHEAIAAAFASGTTATGEPWDVARVDCGGYPGEPTMAYTNSLILNGKVLVPLFGVPEDALALDLYRELMPGYEVLGFSYGPGWFSHDALHCRTSAIFDPGMLRVQHDPPPVVVLAGSGWTVRALVDDRSGAGLSAGQPRLAWRVQGEPDWSSTPMAGLGLDRYEATIPAQAVGTTVEYWIGAADESGRSAQWPPVAPLAWESIRFDLPTSAPPARGPLDLAVSPTPFNPRTSVSFTLAQTSPVRVTVHDVRGRLAAVLAEGDFDAGEHVITWDATGLASGTWFVRMQSGAQTRAVKATLIR